MHRLEAAIAHALLALARALPVAAASNLGGLTARTIGPRLPVSRVADDNLRRAIPKLDAAARRKIIRGAWDNLGRTAAEFPHLHEFSTTASGPGWEFPPGGEAYAREIAEQGGPLLLFSGHIGNWEIWTAVAAAFGLDLAILYRAASNPVVDRMILDMRNPPGRVLARFAKGALGARGALTHLAGGGAISMLVDQKMNEGISVPFFGRPAWTAPAIAAFALRYRCPVIPAFCERIGPARFRLHLLPRLALPDSPNRTANIAALMHAINQTLENWIAAHPESWLWMHRRWPNDDAASDQTATSLR